MSKTKVKKVKLNETNVRIQLLKGYETDEFLGSIAQEKLSQLGEGYAAKKIVAQTRVYYTIRAESEEARRENLENNTLLKVIGV